MNLSPNVARTFLVTVTPLADDVAPATAKHVSDALLWSLANRFAEVAEYQVPAAGTLGLQFALDQRVALRQSGNCGRIRSLERDSEGQLYAQVVLENPIVIPAQHPDERAIEIWRQTLPVWELQAVGEASEVDADQRATSAACAAWFEAQS